MTRFSPVSSRARRGAAGRAMRHAAFCFVLALPAAMAAETLDEAWSAALAADRRLAAVRAERDGADFSLAAARAARYPQLGVATSATQLDDAPSFAFGDDFVSPDIVGGDRIVTGSARVRVPLYTGGSLRDEIASAGSALAASDHRVRAALQELKLAVAEAYVRVLRGERAVGVAESAVRSLRAQTVDAGNRYEAGAVAKNDYLAAGVALAAAEQRALQAANALDVARATYNRQLGRALAATVQLESQLPEVIAELESAGVESLIERALRNRPELEAQAAQVLALRQRSSAVRARTRPQVALSGGYTYLGNEVLDDERFWWLGLGLSWNLFDSGRTRSRAAAVEQQAVALELARADLSSQIALEVRRSWLDWQEARHRTEVANAAVAQAVENLKVARDRYQAGAGTSTEVLDAEALRAASLNNRDNAEFDAALARLRLARAIGDL